MTPPPPPPSMYPAPQLIVNDRSLSAQKQYIDLCDTYGYQVIPSSEQHILLFIAYLYKKLFLVTYIRVYLSVV